MEVTRCRFCGFCDGVSRAIGRARDLVRSGWTVFVDGDLVHNHSVLDGLERENIHRWHGEGRLWKPEECLLIRAHGIAPQRRQWLATLGCKVFDATCPQVGSVAARIRKLRRENFTILLFGERGHPETEALAGHGLPHLWIMAGEGDWQNFSHPGDHCPLALLSQTTADGKEFAAFADRFREKFPWGIVHNTICPSTMERQMELERHLQDPTVDLVIVVGGRHSSNTQKLVHRARAAAKATFSVERTEELHGRSWEAFHHALIGSGTSTPREDGDAVEKFFRDLPTGEMHR
jgi:4-hydroxy-3-methylbut-2-enyl diphosphate reductase